MAIFWVRVYDPLMNLALVFDLIDQGDKVRVIQTLLFIEGINTLLQTLFGTRLPTVIGGSYAFMVPIISIIQDSSLETIIDPHTVSSVFLSHYGISFVLVHSYKSVICLIIGLIEHKMIEDHMFSTIIIFLKIVKSLLYYLKTPIYLVGILSWSHFGISFVI